MKKIISSIVFVFIIMITTVCFANGSGPIMDSYEVVVSNPNGAIIYDEFLNPTERKIAYDTRVNMSYMFYGKDGKLYGIASYYPDKEYWSSREVINIDDITLDHLEEYGIDMEMLDEPYENSFYYILEDGVFLYNGPGFIFGKMPGDIEVKKGQAVKTIKPPNFSLDFEYVEYNGMEGWIPVQAYDSPKVGKIYEPQYNENDYYLLRCDIITYENIYLKDEPYSAPNVFKPVPENTRLRPIKVIDCNFKYADDNIKLYYVKYNGYEGWINENEFVVYREDTSSELMWNIQYSLGDNKALIYTYKDVDIFEDPKLERKIKTIPQYQLFKNYKELYYTSNASGEAFYIETDSINGWLSLENYDSYDQVAYYGFDVSGIIELDADKEIEIEEDIKFYNLENTNFDTIEKGNIIKEGCLLNAPFHDADALNVYIKGDNFSGLISAREYPEIHEKIYNTIYYGNKDKKIKNNENDDIYNNSTNYDSHSEAKDKINEIENKPNNMLTTMKPLVSWRTVTNFVSVLTISFVALETLIYINNRNKKDAEDKDENKDKNNSNDAER